MRTPPHLLAQLGVYFGPELTIPYKWDPGDWRPLDHPTPEQIAKLKELHESGKLPPMMGDRECARRACNSAWTPADANGNRELLPLPAGLDEAKLRHSHLFCNHPVDQRHHVDGDPRDSQRCRQCGGLLTAPGGDGAGPLVAEKPPAKGKAADREDARAEHVTYWSELIEGSEYPPDVAGFAVAAIEARGPRSAASALRRLAACPGWLDLDAADRAVLRTTLVDGASKAKGTDGRRYSWCYPGAANATIGSTTLDGTGWRQPAPPAADATEPASFADVPSVHIAPIVALNVLYGGKLGLMHGPAGGGKTTVLANAVARVTLGAEWLGRPTIMGTVLVVTEDRDTWKDALETAGADQKIVKPVKWRDLAREVADTRPVAVVIDTMQYVASIVGSGELDSAREVDIILRPLEALCRDHGVAVIVTDHEPWADGSGPTDAASGTKKRPRHSGAKVATCDYLLRCSVDNGATTIERGSKVRRGIAVDRIATVDLHGHPVAASAAVSTAAEPAIIEPGDGRQIIVPPGAGWLLPHLQPGESLTLRELRERTGKRKGAVGKAAQLLADAGLWERSGKGGSATNPYRFAVTGTPVPTLPPGTGAPVTVSAGTGTPVPANGNQYRNRSGTGAGTSGTPVPNPKTGTGAGTGAAPVPGTGEREPVTVQPSGDPPEKNGAGGG